MILAHLASATKYLHKNGFVHRNLRPETIIFESDGALSDIKLVDLISVAETQALRENPDDKDFEVFVRSDPYYRAPELLYAKKQCDVKADVWSCGAILYNMVTGIPPFFEKDNEATIEKIKTGVLSC